MVAFDSVKKRGVYIFNALWNPTNCFEMNTEQNRLFSGASPEEVQRDLLPLVDFQGAGQSLIKINQLIEENLLPHLMRYDHAGFQSMYNSIPEQGAALGAQIALAHNQGVTNWQVSPGGAMLEELCCKSLCRLFRLSEQADATFMYSGTYANQEALYLAIHKKAELEGFDFGIQGMSGFQDSSRLVILTSRDAHFSINQSARMLGLGEQNLVSLEVGANRQIDLEQLRKTLAELKGTRDVCCIVATAGTTSTGTIDPIEALLEAARHCDAWLHLDGAYGFSFSLLPECQSQFQGMEKVDSITWDPHKQLGIPIPNSVLFVNDKRDFTRISLFSHYFNRETSNEPNPGIKSPPSTRPMSALPLVTSLLHQGMDEVLEKLRIPLQNIRRLSEHLMTQDDFRCWHEPDTGVLCFQYQPSHVPENRRNDLQTFIYETILREGRRSISVTRLGDAIVLRILVISPDIRYDDLVETITDIRSIGAGFTIGDQTL
ncbi:MAG: aspartate aminotransferase family protein [Gammaproteobacteria bacterium]|nr:aspartate aminotransferase family protein [Gammaproteobacteria bacterium]